MNIKFNGHGGKLRVRILTLATTLTLTGAAALVPFAAVADHTTAHTIEQLQAQIAELTKQLAGLGTIPPSPSGGGGTKCSFTRSLTVGVRGDDVKCLQDYLTSAGHYTYSGGSTGYFGNVTRSAVAAWQSASGVSPAVGYFGTISRAKYDSMVASGGTTPPPTPPPGTPPPPPATGTGLTVTSSAEQPSAKIVPEGSARVPFVKAVLTASADGDVSVKSVKVDRRGLADDAAFDGILLLDENGAQIGTTKTLSSDHQVTLTDGLKVMAGTSKTITIAANMNSSLDNYSGQVGRLAIISVDAGSTTVNGSFPVEGNGMTLNSTLAIGTVTMSIGSLDPGSANTKNVGSKGYYLASVKAAVGSAEDVTFESLRFNQAGSAAAGDLENVMVKAGDKDFPATISSDGKYYWAKFTDGLKIKKGASIEFSVKADLINGSGRTVDMDILRKSDIVVKGDVYAYNILVGGGSTGSASAGAFSSNQEPFFNAYAATISKGSMLVSSSNKVPSGNVAIDVADVTVGGFLLDVKGESIQVSYFTLNMDFSGTGTGTHVSQVKLVDENGAIVAGPKDPNSSGVVAWTDTWTAPVGEKHYLVKAKLGTSFVTNDTVRVKVKPDASITAKGSVTGLTITPDPTSAVTSNTQTVKAGSLAMSVSSIPFGQNVVRGVNGYHFAAIVFDAGSSGEDVRVTSVKLTDTVSAEAATTEINSCVLYDGANALNAGSDVINPANDSTSDTAEEDTFTLTNNLIIPKGTVKKIDLKCNISSTATNNSTHSWGLTIADLGNVSGAQTGQSITESSTTSTGSVMVVKTAGSFTIVKDASSPTSALVLSGKTDVPMMAFSYRAVDEDVRVDELTLAYSSTTASTSDFLKATIWDGATKVGEAVWAGNAQFATSTLSNVVVSKDSTKLLTVKVDLANISTVATATAGRLLSIDYNGTSSSSGVGVSSGQKLGSGSSASLQGDTMQLMKSVPKLEKIAVPSTSVVGSDAVLFRFKVSADAAGPVALYKFTFTVSSSTVSATSSNFRIYGYTDSAFSVPAYATNPLSNQNVDCMSHSTFTSFSSCAANTTVGDGMASTTELVFFFSPVADTASTSEAIVVPAGGERYFQLLGDLRNPNSGTGNTIQVGMAGDTARSVRHGNSNSSVFGAGIFGSSGASNLATAIEIARQSANNNFVWSPMSTSTTLTGATSTPDWVNGFRVPGLPSTGMSANSFTN